MATPYRNKANITRRRRALQLMRRHPGMTNYEINHMLRLEFGGKLLQYKTLAELRERLKPEVVTEKQDRALELMARYPKWTNKQINAVLRVDFDGQFFGKKTLEQLRDRIMAEVVAKVPQFHPVVHTGESRKVLIAEGFLPEEVRELFQNLQVGIDSKLLVAVRKRRIEYIIGLMRRGWTSKQIMAEIRRHNAKPRHSIWDFLKAEYQPKRKVDGAGYRQALEKRRAPSTQRARVRANSLYRR